MSWRIAGRGKDIASSLLDNFIHQLYQVRLLISLVVHFSKILDSVVNKIFLGLAVLSLEINLVEVILNIFFALFVNVDHVCIEAWLCMAWPRIVNSRCDILFAQMGGKIVPSFT